MGNPEPSHICGIRDAYTWPRMIFSICLAGCLADGFSLLHLFEQLPMSRGELKPKGVLAARGMSAPPERCIACNALNQTSAVPVARIDFSPQVSIRRLTGSVPPTLSKIRSVAVLSLTITIRVRRSLIVSCTPGIERADDSGTGPFGGVGKSHAVGEREFAFFDLAKGLGHEGQLDGAHGIHLAVRIDGDLFAGFEAFDIDSPGGVHRPREAFDVRLQAVERLLRRLLGCSGRGEVSRTGWSSQRETLQRQRRRRQGRGQAEQRHRNRKCPRTLPLAGSLAAHEYDDQGQRGHQPKHRRSHPHSADHKCRTFYTSRRACHNNFDRGALLHRRPIV